MTKNTMTYLNKSVNLVFCYCDFLNLIDNPIKLKKGVLSKSKTNKRSPRWVLLSTDRFPKKSQSPERIFIQVLNTHRLCENLCLAFSSKIEAVFLFSAISDYFIVPPWPCKAIWKAEIKVTLVKICQVNWSHWKSKKKNA